MLNTQQDLLFDINNFEFAYKMRELENNYSYPIVYFLDENS